jgi:hypothetical protein
LAAGLVKTDKKNDINRSRAITVGQMQEFE